MKMLALSCAVVFFVGCNQGRELEALRRENRDADVLLAEESDLVKNLPVRREQAQRLLALRSAECAADDPPEIARALSTAAPSAKVTARGGELTFSSEGGQVAPTLATLASRAGFLSLRELQVTPTRWRAELRIRLACESTPSDELSVFPLPEETDWIRAGPERERKRLAATQAKLQAIETELGHDPVRHLTWLQQQVQSARTANQRPTALRGQLPLIDALLAGHPRQLDVRFQSDGAQVSADRPLTASGGWTLAPASGACSTVWCGTARFPR